MTDMARFAQALAKDSYLLTMRLIAYETTGLPWRSVEDEYPELNDEGFSELCLCYSEKDDCFTVSYCEGEGNKRIFACENTEDNEDCITVSHWMYIKRPGGEEEEDT